MQMNKKFLSKKRRSSLYLPGEEISIQREDMFVDWTNKAGSGYAAKGRIFFGACCCAFAYILVAFRLLGTCVLPNFYDVSDTDISNHQRDNIHRADIVDRNGTIIATSLPTKDLDANAKNILSPRETSQKLVTIFPELNFDNVYNKLKRRRGTFTIKRNLSPHQQSLIMALGNPGLEFRSSEKRVYPHKNLLQYY